MAVPKKKTSESRRGKRRAGQHHKLYSKYPFLDPSTGELTMPHCVAPSGVYKGRKVFETKADREEEEETETTED